MRRAVAAAARYQGESRAMSNSAAAAPARRSPWPLLGLGLLVALAAFLRLWGLSWLPSPAGDEGNWTVYALELDEGRDSPMPARASFVSLLYARLIAVSMNLLGPSFMAARLVGASALLVSLPLVFMLVRGLAGARAALASTAVLALHPWSVLWSRTAAVPYALALAVMAVGPLVFVDGCARRSAARIVVAIQVIALGAQFSPLTVVAALACAGWSVLPACRWVLRSPWTYISVTVAAAHVAPVVRSAAAIADDPVNPWGDLGTRLATYAHAVGTGLAGEATIRHFTNDALPATAAWPLVVPVLVLVWCAARVGPPAGGVGGFSVWYMALSVLAVPLLLAPGRQWYLARIDSERYLFAFIPAAALAAGAAAAAGGRIPLLALAFIGWIGLSTSRAAWGLVRGGAEDRGVLVFEGGEAYRGWKVGSERVPIATQIRDAILNDMGPTGATVLLADSTFHVLRFASWGTGLRVHDIRGSAVPAAGPDGRRYCVLWSREQLGRGALKEVRKSNARLRWLMHEEYKDARLVRAIVQPNGFPLIEVWRADADTSDDARARDISE
jgi:hypothetical protein